MEKNMEEKKQKTPKGHEIPVPTKEEFERNLKKVAKPNKSSPPQTATVRGSSSIALRKVSISYRREHDKQVFACKLGF